MLQRAAIVPGGTVRGAGRCGEGVEVRIDLGHQLFELGAVAGISIAAGDLVQPFLGDARVRLEPGVDQPRQLVVDARDRPVRGHQVRSRNVEPVVHDERADHVEQQLARRVLDRARGVDVLLRDIGVHGVRAGRAAQAEPVEKAGRRRNSKRLDGHGLRRRASWMPRGGAPTRAWQVRPCGTPSGRRRRNWDAHASGRWPSASAARRFPA